MTLYVIAAYVHYILSNALVVAQPSFNNKAYLIILIPLLHYFIFDFVGSLIWDIAKDESNDSNSFSSRC